MSDPPAPRYTGPLDREALGRALDEAHAEVTDYFGGLDPDDLFARPADGWAPIDDLRHLRRMGSVILAGLAAPRLLLWWRYGRTRRGSRPYEEVYHEYMAMLSSGFEAPPEFVPPSLRSINREGYRSDLLVRWAGLRGETRLALERWDEAALDRYRLPHPALNRVTIREMLYFMHGHNLHHVQVARRRVEANRAWRAATHENGAGSHRPPSDPSPGDEAGNSTP